MSNLKNNRNLLAYNTLWNFVCHGFPLLIALFSVPALIKGMGIDRFGLLTLAWALIGYASLFDFGMGRALTFYLARELGKSNKKSSSDIARTSLIFLFVIGLCATLLLALNIRWIIYDILNIPLILQDESLSAFRLVVLTIPVVILSTGLRGILQAYQRFDLTTSVEMPMGIMNFMGPLMVLLFTNNLFFIFSAIVLSRFIFFLVYMKLCFTVMPDLRHKFHIKIKHLQELFRFGRWITVSNIVGPIMVYMDRFILGAMLPIASVAYYTLPYQIITKLWIVPLSFGRTLFPVFSATYKVDKNHVEFLFLKGIKYVFLALFPIVIFVLTFAYEILLIWIGTDFASQSYIVLKWLAAGVFINSIAQINVNLIQGTGRPDLTAKLHLCELPIYLISVWWLIKHYGIEGAAIAWTARCIFDSFVLFFMVKKVIPISFSKYNQKGYIFIGTLVFIIIAPFIDGITSKTCFFLFTMSIYSILTWFVFLNDKERKRIYSFLLRKK